MKFTEKQEVIIKVMKENNILSSESAQTFVMITNLISQEDKEKYNIKPSSHAIITNLVKKGIVKKANVKQEGKFAYYLGEDKNAF